MSQVMFCSSVRENGCDWRDVRVYGLWVGHSQFHLCVAHPTFSIADDKIYISLRLDLLEISPSDEADNVCTTGCCNIDQNEAFSIKEIALSEALEFDWTKFSNRSVPKNANVIVSAEDDATVNDFFFWT